MMKEILIIIILSAMMQNCLADGRKIALVIGNSKYEEIGELKNTANDARDISKTLEEIGYETTLLLDAEENKFRRAIRKFASESDNANVAIVFYAGHGAQIAGQNYLLPIDLEIPKKESDIQLGSIKVDDIVNSLKSKVRIVILDACRDNPALIKTLSTGRGGFRGGLAPPLDKQIDETAGGVFIAYATDSGNVALDSKGGKNSPFTMALLKHISSTISIDDMFSLVTKEVRSATNNMQRPFKYASIDGIFCIPGTCSRKNESPSQSKVETASTLTIETNKTVAAKNLPPQKWAYFAANDESLDVWTLDPFSFRKVGTRVTVDVGVQVGKDNAQTGNNEGDIIINSNTIDCKTQKNNVFKTKILNKKGEVKSEKLFGDPELVSLDYDISKKGILGNALLILACNEDIQGPKILPKPNENKNLTHFFSSGGDYGELYINKTPLTKDSSLIYFEILTQLDKPISLTDTKSYTDFSLLKNSQELSYSRSRGVVDCNSNGMTTESQTLHRSDGHIIAYVNYLRAGEKIIQKQPDGPLFEQLRKLYCDQK
jgi:uncharacterized caspase-like protein